MSVVLDDAVVRRAVAKLRNASPADEEAGLLADVLETALRAEPVMEEIDYTAEELLTVPAEQRDRIMAAQAAGAVHFYEADLARPIHERELTIFTSLNSDPVREPDDYLRLP
jgi:hypothetical protein